MGWKERVVFSLVLLLGLAGGSALLFYAGTSYFGGLSHLEWLAKLKFTGELVFLFGISVALVVLFVLARRKLFPPRGAGFWFLAFSPRTRLLFAFLFLLSVNAGMLPLWLKFPSTSMLLINAVLLLVSPYAVDFVCGAARRRGGGGRPGLE